MADLVERVARGICCPRGCECSAQRRASGSFAVCQAHTFDDSARSAISVVLGEMMEPSAGMLAASWDATTTCTPEQRLRMDFATSRQSHEFKMKGRFVAMLTAFARENEVALEAANATISE